MKIFGIDPGVSGAICVLKEGKIVEEGNTKSIFEITPGLINKISDPVACPGNINQAEHQSENASTVTDTITANQANMRTV